MSKAIKYITIILIIWLFWWFSYKIFLIAQNENSAKPDEIKEPTSWTVLQTSWNILQESTWSFLDDSLTWLNDFEKFQKMVDAWKFLSFKFPNQPIINSDTYEWRSEWLNNYLKDNNRYFNKTEDKIASWYFYIKTKKPAEEIFLYRHNTNQWWWWYPISWKLRLEKSKETYSSREYLYDLRNIPIKTFYNKENYSFNRQDVINSLNVNYIWWYVVSFDWTNKIEEIIIAWE